MKMKYCLLTALAAAVLLLSAAGCASTREYPSPAGEEMTAGSVAEETAEMIALLDLGARTDLSDQAVWTAADRLQITAAGTYRLTGSLEGRVTVDADGPVELILEGVTLLGQSCLDVRSGDTVTLYGAPGTENVFTDVLPDAASGEASSPEPSGEAPDADTGAEEIEEAETEAESDASGAVITSKAPLLLAGGSFTVNANKNNGIHAKDGLTMLAGTLTVTAANRGLRARGAITVLGGELTVTAGGDALCAEAGRVVPGSVELRGGRVALTAGDDGITADEILTADGAALTIDAEHDGMQAVTDLTVSGGTLAVTTAGGGGSAIEHAGESFGPWGSQSSALALEYSAKGLKSDGSIHVTGGEIVLNCADDSIHCGTVFTMDAGTLTIVSNDDGIHADDMLVINGGTVEVQDCFEGLEAYAVELRGGDVVIRAVNDGINANGAEMMFRRSTEVETEVTSVSGSSVTYVLIGGGTLDLQVTGNTSNQGDGIDSNGAVYITGGESVISTYGTFMENGVDTGWGGPVVTGGAVIAGGSSTMAEGFGSYSTQCCAVIATSYMPDGTEVVLSDEAGNILWSVTMADAFSCLQISHPDLEVGHVYTLAYGDQSTTLDFTNTNLIENTWGFGFGRPF